VDRLNQGLATGAVSPSEIDRLCAVIAAFTATRTRAYLAAEAARRRVMLAPVSNTVEVMAHDHLAARQFWDVVQQPGSDAGFRHPGRFVVASGTPLRSLGPAPLGGDGDVHAPLTMSTRARATGDRAARRPAVDMTATPG
jgi:crotonobetainyl-CoA:carnitine CoA-transferase CaiB-like acyl-CoA transferase